MKHILLGILLLITTNPYIFSMDDKELDKLESKLLACSNKCIQDNTSWYISDRSTPCANLALTKTTLCNDICRTLYKSRVNTKNQVEITRALLNQRDLINKKAD